MGDLGELAVFGLPDRGGRGLLELEKMEADELGGAREDGGGGIRERGRLQP